MNSNSCVQNLTQMHWIENGKIQRNEHFCHAIHLYITERVYTFIITSFTWNYTWDMQHIPVCSSGQVLLCSSDNETEMTDVMAAFDRLPYIRVPTIFWYENSRTFQGPWSCIFKDQFSTEVYSMDSIKVTWNIYFCDYGTVLVDKNKTWQLLANLALGKTPV